MDETPIPFESLDKTYSTKGAHTVQLKSTRSGWDKRQATLMLTIFADGIGRVKPVLIFHGKSNANRARVPNSRQQRLFEAEQARYHPGVVVIFNEEVYKNAEVMIWWLKSQLFPETLTAMGFSNELAPSERQSGLFALDAAAFHRTDQVLELLRQHNMTPALIPGNCTGLLQPLDVCVNQPFKSLLRDIMEDGITAWAEAEELAREDGRPIATGESAVGERRVLVTHAVGEAWKEFCMKKQGLVIRSFQMTGIAVSVDGLMDSGISIPGFALQNPVVVGDCTRELQPDGSERRVELEDYEVDVSVVMRDDDNGEVHSDGEDTEDSDGVQYAAEVEQWAHTFAGTRSRP
jgi:hypothetical protein